MNVRRHGAIFGLQANLKSTLAHQYYTAYITNTTNPQMLCWYFGTSIRTGRSLNDIGITLIYVIGLLLYLLHTLIKNRNIG